MPVVHRLPAYAGLGVRVVPHTPLAGAAAFLVLLRETTRRPRLPTRLEDAAQLPMKPVPQGRETGANTVAACCGQQDQSDRSQRIKWLDDVDRPDEMQSEHEIHDDLGDPGGYEQCPKKMDGAEQQSQHQSGPVDPHRRRTI